MTGYVEVLIGAITRVKHIHDARVQRRPTLQTFSSCVATALSRTRRRLQPLSAIEVISRQQSDAFIGCRFPHVLSLDGPVTIDPNGRFEACIAPPKSLEHALLYARDKGIFMDSSWRNKNMDSCPLTFVSTVNNYGHLIPGE